MLQLGSKASDETKRKISRIKREQYANGLVLPPSAGWAKWIEVTCSKGTFKVQGTYEYRTCFILDNLLKLKIIKDWDYTGDRIPYIGLDNESHTYILDFKMVLS